MQKIINAVVIDNDPDDVVNISSALVKRGIATFPVHYKSADSANEALKLISKSSPRIIFTDIQMEEGGAKPSKTDIANVAKCLESIATGLKGPYLILAWTSQEESFDELKKYVLDYFTKQSISHPILFDFISKNVCKTDGVNYDADIILTKFDAHLEAQSQLNALLSWEQSVFSCAINSVNELVNTAKDTGEDLGKILKHLAISATGRNVKKLPSFSINEALNLILKDSISQNSLSNETDKLWNLALPDQVGILSEKAKFTLNTMMNFDLNPIDDLVIPGDVWVANKQSEFASIVTTKREIKTEIESFLNEFLCFDEEKSELDNKIKTETDEGKKSQLKLDLATKYTEPRRSAIESSKMVLMEISPSCDFANKKRRLHPLVAGLLIKSETVSSGVKIKSDSESIILTKILFQGIEYYFCVSAKYVFSASHAKINSRDCELIKTFRMRENMHQDFINKISRYNSRIGTLSF